VTFAPTALSSYGGTVTVNSDATSGTSTIAASGTGTAAATLIIGVSGNLAFGNVTMGTTATATLTITNAGNSSLTVSSITYPPGFSGAFSGTIAAGGSQAVTVTFAPTALSSYGGTVTVNSDATSGTNTITASGTGTAAVTIPPTIISPPVITNSLLVVSNQFVVAAGDTNVFNVGATDPVDNSRLRYQWFWGDGGTSAWSAVAVATHIYPTNDCGPYVASVVVSNGAAAVTSNLTVAVACELNLTGLQGTLNFAKTNADTCTVKGKFELPQKFSFANKLATLDVGGAEVSFTLSKKGSGLNGVSLFNKPSYNKKTGWTFNATLKGNWQTAWSGYSMTNTNTPKTGILITNFPVILVVDTEAFMGTKTNLHYTAKPGKSGTAK